MKLLFPLLRLMTRPLVLLISLWLFWGVVQSLIKLSFNLGYTDSLFLVGIGFCSGLLVFSLLSTFSQTYVVGHELTHWLVAKLFRRKTTGLRIGKGQGSVRVERPNMLIVLAPYFFPLYTLIWIIVVKSLEILVKEDRIGFVLYSGVGFTYAYHVVMTILALSKKQNDLRLYGHFFSLCLILTINSFILFVGISCFSNDFRAGWSLLKNSYQYQWQLLGWIMHKLTSETLLPI